MEERKFGGGLTMTQTTKAWAVLWRSECRLDGKVERLVGAPWFPLKTALFASRAKAREYVQQNLGYIKNRKDLRQEPHGWKIPKIVQVEVSYKIRVMQ